MGVFDAFLSFLRKYRVIAPKCCICGAPLKYRKTVSPKTDEAEGYDKHLPCWYPAMKEAHND